jgi:hypothetical protein
VRGDSRTGAAILAKPGNRFARASWDKKPIMRSDNEDNRGNSVDNKSSPHLAVTTALMNAKSAQDKEMATLPSGDGQQEERSIGIASRTIRKGSHL